MSKKLIQPGDKVPLKLAAAERKLVLEHLMCLDRESEQIIRDTPTGKPVMMTLDELDDFGGYIAAEANHCDDKRKEKRLDAVFEKIQHLLDTYTDEDGSTIRIEQAGGTWTICAVSSRSITTKNARISRRIMRCSSSRLAASGLRK